MPHLHWTEEPSILFSAAKTLTTINYTELFLEMIAAKRWKEKGRWSVIVTIEILRYAEP